MIEADFALESELWSAMPDAEILGVAALAKAEGFAGKTLMDGAEVSILLTNDAQIRNLNREWRKIDKATNVLSFPASMPGKLAESPLLGDIVVAFETLKREAEIEQKTIGDHFSHLIVHGFLHLLGFDHQTSADAEAMEALEIRILAALAIANPYIGELIEPALREQKHR